jgi:hypothetical protein
VERVRRGRERASPADFRVDRCTRHPARQSPDARALPHSGQRRRGACLLPERSRHEQIKKPIRCRADCVRYRTDPLGFPGASSLSGTNSSCNSAWMRRSGGRS